MIEQWVIEHKRRKVRFCVVIVESSIGFVCNFLNLHAIVSPGKPRLLPVAEEKGGKGGGKGQGQGCTWKKQEDRRYP